MKRKERLLFLAAGSALLLSNAAFADEDFYADMFSDIETPKAQKTAPAAPSSSYERGTYREITPNAAPRVTDGADVVLSADFIWWRVNQEGTNYAYTGAQIFLPGNANTPLSPTPQGKVASVGKEWAPGFKVGLGLDLCHDGWDLMAQYTWLRPSKESTLKAKGSPLMGGGVYPAANSAAAWGNPGFIIAGSDGVAINPFTSAKGTWGMQFNVIDLELGRNFYLSQFLTLRPHIGFKGTWQEQDLRAFYYGFAQLAPALVLTGPTTLHWNTEQWGIGVRGGLDGAWYFVKTWSLYGNLAWSAMWTHYTHATVKGKVDDESRPSFLFLNSHQNDYTLRYIGEFEIGLRWEMWFNDDDYHVALQAGWEQQIWLDNGLFLNPKLQENYYNLNMHGLDVKLRLDF